MLFKLKATGFTENEDNSFFTKDELEYLGIKITRQCIISLPDKVEAIKNIAILTTKKQLRTSIGLINYYRDKWQHKSEILTPLPSMTSKQAKWIRSNKCQKAFDTIKKIVSIETLLFYPNFNKLFEIHTHTCKLQLGAVISQNDKPIDFCSRKLNSVQVNYATIEHEILDEF